MGVLNRNSLIPWLSGESKKYILKLQIKVYLVCKEVNNFCLFGWLVGFCLVCIEIAAKPNSVFSSTGGASKESVQFPLCKSRGLCSATIKGPLHPSLLSIKAHDFPAYIELSQNFQLWSIIYPGKIWVHVTWLNRNEIVFTCPQPMLQSSYFYGLPVI